MTPHASSPFDVAIVPVVRERKTKVEGAHLIEEGTGLQRKVYIRRPRYLDPEPYTKLYTTSQAWLLALPEPALRAWVYILCQLQPNSETVELRPQDAVRALGWATRQSWYAALEKLEAAGGIARSTKRGFFFINPAYAFNGNRVRRKAEVPK